MTTQTVTLHDVLPLVERLSPTDKSESFEHFEFEHQREWGWLKPITNC